MTTLEILRAARTYLATPGRWRGGNNPTGEACVANACSWVQRLPGEWIVLGPRAYSDAHRLLRRLLESNGPGGVWEWNDAPERTLADVLALLDEAIAIEEAKAQEFTVEVREGVTSEAHDIAWAAA